MISLDLALAIGICGIVALGITPWRNTRHFNQRVYKQTKPQQLLEYIEENKKNQLAIDNKPHQIQHSRKNSSKHDLSAKQENRLSDPVWNAIPQHINSSNTLSKSIKNSHDNDISTNEIITPPIQSDINILQHSSISSTAAGLKPLSVFLSKRSKSNKVKTFLSVLFVPIVLDLLKSILKLWNHGVRRQHTHNKLTLQNRQA